MAAADDYSCGERAQEHNDQKKYALGDDFCQRSREQFSDQSTGCGEGVECSVEPSLPLVWHVALRCRDPDGIACHAADSYDKAEEHHDRYRSEEIDSFRDRDNNIYGQRCRVSVFCRNGDPVMDHPSDRPSDDGHPPYQHIDIFPVFKRGLEPWQYEYC